MSDGWTTLGELPDGQLFETRDGVWFASQFILIASVVRPDTTLGRAVLLGAVYIAGTVTGSVAMHYVALRWLETGKRKVG